MRDAGDAKAALDGRSMFGVKLNLFPCDGGFRDSEAEETEEEAAAEACADDGNSRHEERIRLLASLSHSCSPTATTTTTTTTTPSSIPFPSAPLQSHAPGDTDPDCDQFLVFDGTTAMGRPRSVSADATAGGDDGVGILDPAPTLGSDASYPPSPSVANPGTLYSSPPVSPAAAYIAPQPRGAGRRSSHQRFCEQRGARPRSLNVDLPVDEQVAPAYSSAAYPQPQQQQQQHTSYYYHATPHDPSPYYAPYYSSSSTTQVVPPPAPLHFPLPPASPPNFGYHPEPMNLHTWTWATAAAAAPPGTTAAQAYYGPPPPVASPHLGGMYYSPPPQHISFVGRTRDQLEYDSVYAEHPLHLTPRYPEYIPTTTSMFQQQPPSSPALIPHMGSLLITEPPDTSPSGRDTTPQMHPATGAMSGQQAERNQLNIARIEDGQDTRTTVMVKNIPNKMSDADLIDYINNVCPRKIDFLYLRMDFQNGIFLFSVM